MSARRIAPEFAALLGFAFALRLGAFYLEPNIHWPDEIFQGMEPAHRLVFGTGAVAWEWVVGARSWLFPGLLAALMEMGRLFGTAPSIVDLPVAIFLAAAGCVPAACAYGWGRRFGGRAGGFVAASVPAAWVDLVYMSCHSLAEVAAADCLPAALYLGLPWSGEAVSRRRLWIAGALLGLTFALRFHLAPALALAAFAMCGWRRGWSPWRALLAGASVPILAMGLLDWATFGTPFQSIAFNLWFNLAESGDYAGRSPVATLIVLPLYLWGAGFAAMLFTAILGAWRLPAVGGVAVIIFAIYSIIAHKEYRFIYPGLVLIAVLAGIGSAELLRHWRQARRPIFASVRLVAAVAALAWFGVSAAIAHSAVYRNAWTRERAQLLAFDYLSHRSDLCGVGLYGVWWIVTPGRSGLPRAAGFYQSTRSGLTHDAAAFNYLAAWGRTAVPDPRYRRVACFDGDEGEDGAWQLRVCVWRRDGGCAPEAAPPFPMNWPSTITGKAEVGKKFDWNDP